MLVMALTFSKFLVLSSFSTYFVTLIYKVFEENFENVSGKLILMG